MRKNNDKSKFFIKDGFDKAVEEHMKTLELRNMYPFDKNGDGTYNILGCGYNIKKQNDSFFKNIYKNKDKSQLVAEIHAEVNRALHYLMVNHLDWQDGFHHQRMNALCYAKILTSGLSEYGIKNYSEEEKQQYIENALKEHIDGSKPKIKMNEEEIDSFKKLVDSNVKKYGITRVIIKPLFDKKYKINYNLKELKAIHFMIAIGEFENLC